MQVLKYLSVIFCCGLFACNKNSTNNYTQVNVKVIQSVCASSVLQITDPQYQYLGDTTYINNGIAYPGAFYTDALLASDCAAMLSATSTSNNQSIFTIKVSTTHPVNPVNSCFDRVFCAAIVSNPPKVTLYVVN
jgi:hypothetical protein